MLILMSLIARMYKLEYTESEIIGMLADLEANAFDTYTQGLVHSLGLEPLTDFQVNRLCESISKWESALNVTKMRIGA